MDGKITQAGGDTIFGKIIRGEIKTEFLHEDDQCVAFDDIEPQAPVHFLVVPKKAIPKLSDAQDSDEKLIGHLMVVARAVAKQKGLSEGFRVVINDGPQGGQEVMHIHVHVMGGRQLTWPPG
ncbi:hypothetical protein RRG08_020368 [Elysia crispata]|uniref:HIT domain-containing protein n=1 Tax=Elysia crispata TaxID=231223 RepID=A0AAE1DYP7_9GAST|nr:hypothetical protein RRG08_020368 [Elysia crispata]